VSRIFLKTALWLPCLCGLAATPKVLAQESLPAVLDTIETGKILNQVFSRPEADFSKSQFSIVLRYLPSFEPEEQILLTYDVSSSGHVTYETLKIPLRKALGESDDRATLSSRAGLRTTTASVRGLKIVSWFRNLTASMASSLPLVQQQAVPNAKTHEVTLLLDPTSYIIEIDALENHISFDVVGSELGSGGDPRDLPLIKYMLQIRKEVRALTGAGTN
jgi:hypothetical protein